MAEVKTWQEVCPECGWASEPHPSYYPAMVEAREHYAETGHRRLPLDEGELLRRLLPDR